MTVRSHPPSPPSGHRTFNDNGDGFFGYQSQRCESYSNFPEDDAKDPISDPIPSSGFGEEIPVHHHGSSTPALPEGYGEYWDPFLMPESNGKACGEEIRSWTGRCCRIPARYGSRGCLRDWRRATKIWNYRSGSVLPSLAVGNGMLLLVLKMKLAPPPLSRFTAGSPSSTAPALAIGGMEFQECNKLCSLHSCKLFHIQESVSF